MNTVINSVKISSFTPIKDVGDNIFEVRWGRKDERNSVFCSFEEFRFFCKPNTYMLDNLFETSIRQPSMKELHEIGVVIGLNEEQLLKWLKERLEKAIMLHDSSEWKDEGENCVNDFTINGEHLWLDKNTRTGLDGRFAAEIAAGKTETTLWANGKSYTLPLFGDNSAPNLKIALELYASESYDNTQRHVAAKNAMTSIDEVVSYDWRTGYPEKLAF